MQAKLRSFLLRSGQWIRYNRGDLPRPVGSLAGHFAVGSVLFLSSAVCGIRGRKGTASSSKEDQLGRKSIEPGQRRQKTANKGPGRCFESQVCVRHERGEKYALAYVVWLEHYSNVSFRERSLSLLHDVRKKHFGNAPVFPVGRTAKNSGMVLCVIPLQAPQAR
jgi:hypothetical protein